MAQGGSRQKRAQGAGRPANSEPKIQLFKDFSGVNFEHALMEASSGIDSRQLPTQTDLQMNYLYLQNNVATASNKTLETRDDIVELFAAPSGVKFTGPVCLIGSEIYVAKSDKNIGHDTLSYLTPPDSTPIITNNLTLNNAGTSQHVWTSLDYYDNKLIGQTAANEMWVGDVNSYDIVTTMANAKQVSNPDYSFNIGGYNDPRVINYGSLEIRAGIDDSHPFRVSVACTYINKYGPTAIGTTTTFYANYPVSEWHSGCYARFRGTFSPNTGSAGSNGIKAVELYYSTDNAMEMLFLGRVDVASGATSWTYNWYGYVDATSMWPMANLIAPTENYTKGVHASHMCNIDGRMYFWGDSSNPQRLYIGGNPGNLLSISPGTGGGFVDVEPGTGQKVRYVCKYKTQSGNSIVTMLCDSKNTRKEQRFNLVEDTISLSNEQSMTSWEAEQVAGAIGCKSYRGAVVCEDGLYSISRYGLALTTMTMEYNSQIRTNYVSDAIKPAFVDMTPNDQMLMNSMLIELDGVIYMAFGAPNNYSSVTFDNVLFCYDIDNKAWWTYTLDVDKPILNLFHVDYEGRREGIGIVTESMIYMLPTTLGDDIDSMPTYDFLVETGSLSTQMPQQGWQYLSQLEFHFDRFIGNACITVRMVDMFGRVITVSKSVSEPSLMWDYVIHMRIDQRVMSYSIVMSGSARFRMSHFLARVYTLSNKIGQVWGFDDSISHRSSGDVHPTFKCYNDVRKAIFT